MNEIPTQARIHEIQELDKNAKTQRDEAFLRIHERALSPLIDSDQASLSGEAASTKPAGSTDQAKA